MWKFLNKVTEVLAPTVHTTLDEFKDQWRGIRAFYIDKKRNFHTSFLHINFYLSTLQRRIQLKIFNL